MANPCCWSFILFLLLVQSVNAFAGQPALNIVSQNLHRFFDDKDDGHNERVVSSKKYQRRIQQLVQKISTEFDFAEVIAVQEIENKAILQDISKQLKIKYAEDYQPVLIEGNDISGIDVGFLIKKDFQIKSVDALFSQKIYRQTTEKLFSRPPLLINICRIECINIVNVHLRSMKGLRSSKQQKRVSLKRRLQAETLARWIDKFQHGDPQKKLIIVGDFNALKPSDVYVDSLGTIIGNPDQKRPRWKSPDLVKTDLINTSLMVKPKFRYSYKYKKKNQLLDYLLISNNLHQDIKSISYSRIDYKFSDHAALKAKLLIH